MRRLKRLAAAAANILVALIAFALSGAARRKEKAKALQTSGKRKKKRKAEHKPAPESLPPELLGALFGFCFLDFFRASARSCSFENRFSRFSRFPSCPSGFALASAPRGAQSASARRQARASARDERADIASGSALAREASAVKTSRRGFVASFLPFRAVS